MKKLKLSYTSPDEDLKLNVTKHGMYERNPLTISCNATNGNWKFCKWFKGKEASCTYEYESTSSLSKWVVTKCEGTRNCQKCDTRFEDFKLTSQLDESVEGESNTMCEIRKPRAQLTFDDGEYTCQLLKCAAPEDEGCNASPDQFDQYDVLREKQNNTVHVKVVISCSRKSNFQSNLIE